MRRQLAADAVLPLNERSSNVVLALQGNKRYVFPRALLETSDLISEILMDAEDDAAFDIPLMDIAPVTMERVIEYLEKHQHDSKMGTGTGRTQQQIERPLRQNLKEVVDPWDWAYLMAMIDRTGSPKLFSVLKAAVFLVIPNLRDLCCACVANMIREKSEAEILTMFGIDPTVGFSAEEEEALVKEFPWLADPQSSSQV